MLLGVGLSAVVVVVPILLAWVFLAIWSLVLLVGSDPDALAYCIIGMLLPLPVYALVIALKVDGTIVSDKTQK